MSELNERQKRFCYEYLKDLNGTQSAIRAGYSEKTANEQASRLLANVNIQALISELNAQRQKETRIDAEYVLKRLVEIDQLDLLDIMHEDLSLKPLSEWPLSWRRTVSTVDVQELFEGSGDEREMIGFIKKIKGIDKVKNLELLGKHIAVGAFKEQMEIKGQIAHSLVDLMKEIEDGEEEELEDYEKNFSFGTIDKG